MGTGVIMFLTLRAKLPFHDTTKNRIIARILRQNVQTVDAHWQSVSEAKELIAKLLVKNPAQRITVEHAMEHEWFEPIREHKRLSDQQKATTKKGDEAKADEGMEAQHRGASVKDIKVY